MIPTIFLFPVLYLPLLLDIVISPATNSTDGCETFKYILSNSSKEAVVPSGWIGIDSSVTIPAILVFSFNFPAI